MGESGGSDNFFARALAKIFQKKIFAGSKAHIIDIASGRPLAGYGPVAGIFDVKYEEVRLGGRHRIAQKKPIFIFSDSRHLKFIAVGTCLEIFGDYYSVVAVICDDLGGAYRLELESDIVQKNPDVSDDGKKKEIVFE